jgi:hypothetical protein
MRTPQPKLKKKKPQSSNVKVTSGHACCICGKALGKSRTTGTLLIQRGVIDIFDKSHKVNPRQAIWIHGRCLINLIPIAEYSFPELKPR